MTHAILPPAESHVVRGACPHDCPDTCALLTTVQEGRAIRVQGEIGGIEVRGPRLRQRLLEQGLPLDQTGQRMLFPRDIVERALANAPRSVSLYDRVGQLHATLGGDKVHFVPGSSGLYVFDHRTGVRRPAMTADFVEYVRLASGLEHIAYLATAFSTGDVPPAIADAWRLYLVLTQSAKPVVSGAFTENVPPDNSCQPSPRN